MQRRVTNETQNRVPAARSQRPATPINAAEAHRIVAKIEALETDLSGDVKRLTNFTPEYRLRAGNYRVLFEIKTDKVIIHRVKHRKDAYSRS